MVVRSTCGGLRELMEVHAQMTDCWFATVSDDKIPMGRRVRR